jgi:hypothetical protein
MAAPVPARLQIKGRLRRRQWPILATVVTLVAGMTFSLVSTYTVRGLTFWMVPQDIWAAYRSAHYIGWGAYGSIYAAGTSLVTFPAILLLFAPVAMITQGLGLSEDFPYVVPHPTAWLVLGPYEILLSCSALFACDALAERIGVSPARRFWLCVCEAVVLWNVDVVWGHPEDALALALGVYALVAAFDGRWTRVGWLFGVALATQPLVVLMLPVLVGMGRRRQLPGIVARAALPTVLLMIVPFAAHFHDTFHAVFDQPNFPGIDHVTPWTALAPHLGGKGSHLVVAAGPGRLVAVALAGLIGIWVWRRRPGPEGIVVAVALALALRCFTESVMVPFYIWPPLAVGLVGAARLGVRRLAAAGVAAAAVTVFADYRWLPWLPWWLVVTGSITIVLICARPPSGTPDGSDVGDRSDMKNRSSSVAEMPENLHKDGSVLTAPP